MSAAYPVIASPPFGPANYELAIFQPNSLLTAGQLNAWFNFAAAQEQATRARLLGVGVSTGLVPSWSRGDRFQPATVDLTAGCGVTTEGLLLRLEETQRYRSFKVYEPSADATDVFQNFDSEVLELSTDLPSDKELGHLDTLDGADWAVMLFQQMVPVQAAGCTTLNCEDKGLTYKILLRVLLVRRTDALRHLGLQPLLPAGRPYAGLARLRLARQPATGTSHRARLMSAKNFLSDPGNPFEALVEAITTAATALQYTTGFSDLFSGDVSKYISKLLNKIYYQLGLVVKTNNVQYAYEWLKDLYAAYDELRQAMADPDWLTQAMPPTSGFGRYLVVGELNDSKGRLQCRHHWRPAPSTANNPNAPAHVLWLWQRIEALITGFTVPKLPTSVYGVDPLLASSTIGYNVNEALSIGAWLLGQTITDETHYAYPADPTPAAAQYVGSLAITPDRARPANFDQRSLPFYYQADVRQQWSHRRTLMGETDSIPAYKHVVADELDPLIYQLDEYDFFRIEGILDVRADYVLSALLAARREYNLPFDVVAVRADTPTTTSNQPLLTQLDAQVFADLQVAFLDALLQLRAAEQADNLAHPFGLSSTYPSTSYNAPALTLAAAKLGELYANYRLLNVGLNDTQKSLVELLISINAAYHERVADLVHKFDFRPFLLANPGLELGAGAPKGGTFVFVYRTPATPPQGVPAGVPLVVASYNLPYRLNGPGLTVQIGINTLPASDEPGSLPSDSTIPPEPSEPAPSPEPVPAGGSSPGGEQPPKNDTLESSSTK